MKKLTENKNLIELVKFCGLVIGLLAFIFGVGQWIDARYVDQRIFAMYQQQQQAEKSANEQRLVSLFMSIEKERERDLSLLFRSIKDASMMGLRVRRDILITRGRDNLTSEERAELDILETRLREIEN